MENVHQVGKRVEKIVAKCLPRLKALVIGTVQDPRKRRGLRHDFGETELRYFVTNATTGMLHPEHLLLLMRRHWSIAVPVFWDCNWTFDMQFGEDDRRWCTENMALLTLGVLRMVAYNTQQHLRKCHVVVHHQRAVDSPRPWRETAELVLDCFKGLPKAFVATLGSVTRGNLRRAAASPSG